MLPVTGIYQSPALHETVMVKAKLLVGLMSHNWFPFSGVFFSFAASSTLLPVQIRGKNRGEGWEGNTLLFWPHESLGQLSYLLRVQGEPPVAAQEETGCKTGE